MFKTILARLSPREDKFFKLISALAEQAAACATYLQTFIESDDKSKKADAYNALTGCRAESKRLSSEITRELCSTFITPFDREDIQDFSLSLYKIVKTTQKICARLQLHNLISEKGDFQRQTGLIVLEAEAMRDMVHELTSGRNNSERVMKKVDVLYELENKGDAMLGELLAQLFRDHDDARGLILRKDIYDMLEKVIDRYRDAAAVALQIVLKHS